MHDRAFSCGDSAQRVVFNSACGIVAGSSQNGGRSGIVFNNRFHQSLSAIFYAQHMDIEKGNKKEEIKRHPRREFRLGG